MIECRLETLIGSNQGLREPQEEILEVSTRLEVLFKKACIDAVSITCTLHDFTHRAGFSTQEKGDAGQTLIADGSNLRG